MSGANFPNYTDKSSKTKLVYAFSEVWLKLKFIGNPNGVWVESYTSEKDSPYLFVLL